MRWKRPPRAVSTSRPVDRVASATSSMVMVEPIKVAISPLHAALASGKSVTSIASRSNDEGAVTGQRCPPTMACSVVLGCFGERCPIKCDGAQIDLQDGVGFVGRRPEHEDAFRQPLV